MKDRREATIGFPRKVMAALLVPSVLLVASIVAPAHQYSVVNEYKSTIDEYKTDRDADRREVLAAAIEAFGRYHNLSDKVNAHDYVLINFTHTISFNKLTRQWFVAFRHADVGISATTVYVFRVKVEHSASLESVSNWGSL